MPLRPWKKLTEKTLSKNKWWTYKLDTFELPNGGGGEYHYVATKGASMVIRVLDDGRIAMVKQYRYLNGRESLEFVCGGVKENQSYDDTATQELAEEAGLRADRFQMVGEFNPYNGVTNEICKVYLAFAVRTSPARPDPTEEFEVLTLPPDEIESRIARREIWDGMTLAGWTIVRNLIGKK